MLKLLPFALKIGELGVGLRVDRHILASGHGHRASYKPGTAGHEHLGRQRTCRRDANHEAGGRDDPVVRTKYGGAQPTDAIGPMALKV